MSAKKFFLFGFGLEHETARRARPHLDRAHDPIETRAARRPHLVPEGRRAHLDRVADFDVAHRFRITAGRHLLDVDVAAGPRVQYETERLADGDLALARARVARGPLKVREPVLLLSIKVRVGLPAL